MKRFKNYISIVVAALLFILTFAMPAAAASTTCEPTVYYGVYTSNGTALNGNCVLPENLGNIDCIIGGSSGQITVPPSGETTPDTDTDVTPDINSGTENTPAYSVSEYEQRVVTLVNEQRTANGLSALTLNTELSNVARIKSQDMKDNGYFSHTSPTYGSPFDMMKQFGITYRTAGENIAMGQATPEAVVDAWMNSEGHRANILNSSFTQIGVGYVTDGNYWTQMFIG